MGGGFELGSYVLSMSCVSGDNVQVSIHRREDIFRWLRKLDHEGSSWAVHHHDLETALSSVEDITEEIEGEYVRPETTPRGVERI